MAVQKDFSDNSDVPWATASAAEVLAGNNGSDVSAKTTKGLLVLAAGNLEIHPKASAAALPVFAVTAGQIVPINCKLVRTGTTATVAGLA